MPQHQNRVYFILRCCKRLQIISLFFRWRHNFFGFFYLSSIGWQAFTGAIMTNNNLCCFICGVWKEVISVTVLSSLHPYVKTKLLMLTLMCQACSVPFKYIHQSRKRSSAPCWPLASNTSNWFHQCTADYSTNNWFYVLDVSSTWNIAELFGALFWCRLREYSVLLDFILWREIVYIWGFYSSVKRLKSYGWFLNMKSLRSASPNLIHLWSKLCCIAFWCVTILKKYSIICQKIIFKGP